MWESVLLNWCRLDDARVQICKTLGSWPGDKNILEVREVQRTSWTRVEPRDKRRVGLGWTYSGEKVKAQLQVHLMPTKTSNKRAIQVGC